MQKIIASAFACVFILFSLSANAQVHYCDVVSRNTQSMNLRVAELQALSNEARRHVAGISRRALSKSGVSLAMIAGMERPARTLRGNLAYTDPIRLCYGQINFYAVFCRRIAYGLQFYLKETDKTMHDIRAMMSVSPSSLGQLPQKTSPWNTAVWKAGAVIGAMREDLSSNVSAFEPYCSAVSE